MPLRGAAWSALQLKVLDLNQTGVSGVLPAKWGSAAASSGLGAFLQELYLHQTQLSGEIPTSWLTSFPNVTRFTVWGTDVCGLHPQNGTGLGALCLDTTRTRLGEHVAYCSSMQQASNGGHAVSS